MNNRQYFEEHFDFLRDGYRKMNVRNLTRAFNEKFGTNKTEAAIGTILYKKKIKCGRSGNEKLIENKHRLLTPEQDVFVRNAYKQMTIVDVTAALNEKFGTNFGTNQIDAYCANHRILSGRSGFFRKNITPWNKGKKGLLSANSGSFKPGNVPATIKPLYSERLSKDGLIEIKVPMPHKRKGTATQYMPKQRWVYQQHFGPIPAGKVVSFKDGNTRNFDPDNLLLLSRAEVLRLTKNNYRRMPEEIKPAVLALSKLQVKISEKRKDVNG